jgi:hypothetical protein
MNRIRQFLGALLCLVVFGAALLGYFVTDGNGHDGLGRSLSSAPFFMRLFFGQERAWAGWFWFVADIVWFWGGLGLGFVLLSSKPKSG